MIKLMSTDVGGHTARFLRGLLRARGVRLALEPGSAQGIVSYGVRVRPEQFGNIPVLNGEAGRLNKLSQLRALQQAGVPVPPHGERDGFTLPAFGRKLRHHGGRDLMAVMCSREIPWRRAAGAEYFVSYVAHEREFRVWVYRRRILGCYEKVCRYPERYRGLGASRKNGFAFVFRDRATVPESVRDASARAVEALGLDFGAVDVLYCRDFNNQRAVADGSRACVLEVNTAPGVEGERQGIARLADKIAAWEQGGFLRRRGTGGQQS